VGPEPIIVGMYSRGLSNFSSKRNMGWEYLQEPNFVASKNVEQCEKREVRPKVGNFDSCPTFHQWKPLDGDGSSYPLVN